MFENVAILVTIAVNEDRYREDLGAAEGIKEDKGVGKLRPMAAKPGPERRKAGGERQVSGDGRL